MPFCRKCGTELVGDEEFCPKCGAPVRRAKIEAEPTAELPQLQPRTRKRAALVGAVVILIISATIATIFMVPVSGERAPTWFMDDWAKRRLIAVSNPLNTALDNYQVKIVVPYDDDMQADFGDLRFTLENGDEIPFWIENYSQSGSATVWVRVPTIPASTPTTICMYYNNPIATSASNGDATFIFFDNFDAIDTTEWNQTPGWSVSNGVIFADADNKNLVSIQTWSFSGKAIHARVKTNEAGPQPQVRFLISATDENYPQNGPSVTTINSGDGIATVDLRAFLENARYSTPLDTNWHDVIHKNADGSVIGVYDDESQTVSTGIPDTIYVAFRIDGDGGTAALYIDHVFMRKYALPELEPSIGYEISKGTEEVDTSFLWVAIAVLWVSIIAIVYLILRSLKQH